MQHRWTCSLAKHCVTVAALFVVAVTAIAAQTQTAYPTRNIRVIVPSPTGGPSDIVARLLGDKLGAALGKQVGAHNRVAASQIIGAHMVAKADPAGYTLLQAAANMSINPVTVPDLPFDPVKDF